MKTFQDLLKELQACSEAREWAGEMTVEEVVNTCHRGDWLLWVAKKVNINNRNLTLAKGLCANTVRHLMKDERSLSAVDAAIAYGEGGINEEELRVAAYAADAAADAAAYASAYAAEASAYAASASDDGYAVASAAAEASAYDASAFARKENQMQTANICREIIGQEIIEKVNELMN